MGQCILLKSSVDPLYGLLEMALDIC